MKEGNVFALFESHIALLQELRNSMKLWHVTPYFLTPLPMMMDSLDMVVVRWWNCLLEPQVT